MWKITDPALIFPAASGAPRRDSSIRYSCELAFNVHHAGRIYRERIIPDAISHRNISNKITPSPSSVRSLLYSPALCRRKFPCRYRIIVLAVSALPATPTRGSFRKQGARLLRYNARDEALSVARRFRLFHDRHTCEKNY